METLFNECFHRARFLRVTRAAMTKRPRKRTRPMSYHRRPPWRRWFPVLVILLVVLLTPMFVHAQALPDSVALEWTESGDDGMTGNAVLLDLRQSTVPITPATWDSATTIAGVPGPMAPGTARRYVVRGLTNGVTYWFAIRERDDAGNWSNLSNVVRWNWTYDDSAPAPPSGLSASRLSGGARLSWLANLEGDLAGYNVYRAMSDQGPFARINDSLLTLNGYDDPPVGMPAAWYRVTALDLAGNESAPSPFVSVSLSTRTDVLMKPAYPNPSPLAATVRIPVIVTSLGNGARAEILDSGGHRVRRLDLRVLSPGANDLVWDGTNDAGRRVAPGVYSAVMIADGQSQVVRMVRVP